MCLTSSLNLLLLIPIFLILNNLYFMIIRKEIKTSSFFLLQNLAICISILSEQLDFLLTNNALFDNVLKTIVIYSFSLYFILFGVGLLVYIGTGTGTGTGTKSLKIQFLLNTIFSIVNIFFIVLYIIYGFV